MSADNPRITEQPEQQADKHISRQQNNASRACSVHLPRHPPLVPDIVQKNYAAARRWHQPLHNRITSSLASITRLAQKSYPTTRQYYQTLRNFFYHAIHHWHLALYKRFALTFSNSAVVCATDLAQHSPPAQAFAEQIHKNI